MLKTPSDLDDFLSATPTQLVELTANTTTGTDHIWVWVVTDIDESNLAILPVATTRGNLVTELKPMSSHYEPVFQGLLEIELVENSSLILVLGTAQTGLQHSTVQCSKMKLSDDDWPIYPVG